MQIITPICFKTDIIVKIKSEKLLWMFKERFVSVYYSIYNPNSSSWKTIQSSDKLVIDSKSEGTLWKFLEIYLENNNNSKLSLHQIISNSIYNWWLEKYKFKKTNEDYLTWLKKEIELNKTISCYDIRDYLNISKQKIINNSESKTTYAFNGLEVTIDQDNDYILFSKGSLRKKVYRDSIIWIKKMLKETFWVYV